MNKFLSLVISIFTISLILPVSGYSLTAMQIIKKSENAIRGNTQASIMVITIKTRRWTRSLKMKSYESRRLKKSFSEIISPKKDAGNRFLLIRKTMRHYIPKLSRVIKISPSMMLQSWMGSDFTNDDIVKESSITEDYIHHKGGKETIDGHLCYKIILKPKPKAPVVWGKIIYYARVKDYLPVKEEFYSERGKLKKVMTLSKFRRMGGRVIPTWYKMQTVKKKNRFTVMEIKKIRFNVRIPSRVFSLQNLKRR